MSETITFQARTEPQWLRVARRRGKAAHLPVVDQDSRGYEAMAPYGALRVHRLPSGQWRASLLECGEAHAAGTYATREEAEAAAIEWGTKGGTSYHGTEHERHDWKGRM